MAGQKQFGAARRRTLCSIIRMQKGYDHRLFAVNLNLPRVTSGKHIVFFGAAQIVSGNRLTCLSLLLLPVNPSLQLECVAKLLPTKTGLLQGLFFWHYCVCVC